MSQILREKYLKLLEDFVRPGKITMLFGPRRVGKTTLMNDYLRKFPEQDVFKVEGDDPFAKGLHELSINALKQTFSNYSVIAFEEAQRIFGIDMILKRLVDNIDSLRILVTGSSSFDIVQKTTESLTGRKNIIQVHPFAQFELMETENFLDTKSNLELRLIYGSYPQVVLAESNSAKRKELGELKESYLMKDVLAVEGIKNSRKIANLVKLLAYQIGQEVSVNELTEQLGKEDRRIDNKTVAKYLDLLEKCFVIFSRPAFNTKPRKEIIGKKKYYFYDNGMRNAVIGNYNDLSMRDSHGHEAGRLWENYIVVERMKFNDTCQRRPQSYFWRAKDANNKHQEIDLIEIVNENMGAFEIKYSDKKVKIPSVWRKLYWETSFDDKSRQEVNDNGPKYRPHFNLIHRDNYLEFICPGAVDEIIF